eukprot:46141_1
MNSSVPVLSVEILVNATQNVNYTTIAAQIISRGVSKPSVPITVALAIVLIIHANVIKSAEVIKTVAAITYHSVSTINLQTMKTQPSPHTHPTALNTHPF